MWGSSQVQGAVCLLDPDNKQLSLGSTAAWSAWLTSCAEAVCAARLLALSSLVAFSIIGTFRARKVPFWWGKPKKKKKKKIKMCIRVCSPQLKTGICGRFQFWFWFWKGVQFSELSSEQTKLPHPYNLNGCETCFEMEGCRERGKRPD